MTNDNTDNLGWADLEKGPANSKTGKLNAKKNSSKRKNNNKRKRVNTLNASNNSFTQLPMTGTKTRGRNGNDPKWYTNIPLLAKDAATVPFNVPAGIAQTYYRTNEDNSGNRVQVGQYSAACYTPGVMAFNICPVLGGKGPTSAVNVAAQQLYAKVRQANSGATNYDKTDLMKMILAMDSAYMLYEHLVRAYKVAISYDVLNRYRPAVLSRALNIPLDLIQNNLADYRAMLDMFAYKLSSIPVPDQFDFITRHSWLFSNIWKDSENPRGNMMVFVPRMLYIWQEVPDAAGKNVIKSLVPTETFFRGMRNYTSIGDFVNLIGTILNPMLGSQDVGTMSGDLLKAFGVGGMINVTVPAEHNLIEPVYNKEVMSQIENMTIMSSADRTNISGEPGSTYQAGMDWANNYWSILEVNNDLVAGPYLEQSLMLYSNRNLSNLYNIPSWFNPIINMHWDNPTSDDVMVATRLTALTEPRITNPSGVTTAAHREITTYGTEICLSARIYSFGMFDSTAEQAWVPTLDELSGKTVGEWQFSTQRLCGPSISMNSDWVGRLSMIESFDWHPTIYNILYDTSDPATANLVMLAGVSADLDNYKVIEASQLQAIHDVAIMSLYKAKSF